MPGEQRSLQEHIRARQQSGFIARHEQVVQYRVNLGFAADDERRRFLFNIHGNAGVGKTFLVRQLRQVAIDAGALTAYVDESVDDVIAAMTTAAEQLGHGGGKFSEFEKRAAQYRQLRHELESDPRAPDGIAAFLTKTAVTIGVAAARDIPIAGSVFAPIDSVATADQVNRAREYLTRKLRDHRRMRLLLSPADELTPVFVAGLHRIAPNRPIALFFDTYERTALTLDRWLRCLYAGRYGDLPEMLVTTISGQKRLDLNSWSDYLPIIADISLQPFSEAEARQFLASKEIADESTIQVILTLSGRLPLWLATLADARRQGRGEIGDPTGHAVERFLKWEGNPARREIAITAALPRSFNRDTLAVIAPTGRAHELFSWLRELPFVSQRGQSWAYHEVVRAAMLRLLRAEAPADWRSVHKLLARANADWASNTIEGAGNKWASSEWADYTREETYHGLCADPHGKLAEALASAVKAAEHSMTRAGQWAVLISDAGRDANSDQLKLWGKRLTDSLRDEDLSTYLTCIINSNQLDLPTLVTALTQRGANYRAMDRYADALADLSRAIELDPSSISAYAMRGAVRSDVQRYEESIADLTRALEIDPVNTWVIANRGNTFRAMGHRDQALADLNRAIEIDPVYSWAIAMRGQTYRELGRREDALADLNRAIEIDTEDIFAFAMRGDAYRTMGRCADALADLNRAIELNYAMKLRPSKALCWILTRRGETYRAMERYGEALADYDLALTLNPSDEEWIATHRGDIYRQMGRYAEAIADYDRAIELNSNADDYIVKRNEIRSLMSPNEV